MKSIIRCVYEENNNKNKIILGILLNDSVDGKWHCSYPYIYTDGVYVFFKTITDLINYNFYGSRGMLRAYLEEPIFDKYYEVTLNDKFENYLDWLTE